ncbi:MAG TPA: 50S ribosomal protein L3 [Candidatus Saccharimonadales bacterium]|nr:50S ribosomal protein L3 [Candidatus Saccharimonadales bacterium]
MDTILGSKIKMGQTYVEGVRTPISIVSAGPCVVTQVKTKAKDGYWAIQVGFGEKKLKNTTKPMQGHLKKVTSENKLPRHIREIKLTEESKYKVGDIIKVSDIFNSGDRISVTGISKGKGFAGGVKRWHFSGGSKTHGQSDRQRAPGSIGQGTTPGRVYKGKHMAGRMGSERIKIKGLSVVKIDAEKNLMEISGPIPGTVGKLITIQKVGGKVNA